MSRPPRLSEVSAGGESVRIREGGPGDVPAVVALLDGAVEWLVARGRTGQWGTEPWSARPEAVERVTEIVRSGAPWMAELGGRPVGVIVLAPHGSPGVPPAGEPEVFIRLLVTDRRFAGRDIGGALLRHAVEETRRQGRGLLRVDCYAGGDGALIEYYTRHGFHPVERFAVGDWPGQLLAQRV
ncbi:GNAT family N-acetyltransferase [Streptomyces albus]|uniref:GNAT family N-acetyltransferase n=1 Tax=Streptomyces albus TaxID=1888 RepID=UPI001FCA3E4D|nr:GNAT family N-acetyltransferase [Streptomyces albus]